MTKQEAIEQGAKYYYMMCKIAYVHLPKKWYNNISCEGAYITECRHCGCDLICYIETDELVRI